MIFVGSLDKNSYALNMTNGELVWKYATNATVASTPAVRHFMLFVWSSDGNLYATDAATGSLQWRFVTGAATTNA